MKEPSFKENKFMLLSGGMVVVAFSLKFEFSKLTVI